MELAGRDGRMVEVGIADEILRNMSEEELLNLLPPYSSEHDPTGLIKFSIDGLFFNDLAAGFTPFEAFTRTLGEYVAALLDIPSPHTPSHVRGSQKGTEKEAYKIVAEILEETYKKS